MALLGLILFVAGLCLVPLRETDLFFRLANGDEILRSGHVPGRNLFSFTFPDQPYPDPAWVFDVAVAGLYRLGGFPAVVAGKTAVVGLTFVVAYLLLCRRSRRAPHATGRVIAALMLAAAASCMRERLVERPHVVSLLGEVVVLALLPALQSGQRRAWLLVPVVALWANLHAGAFVGPLLIALAGLGVLLEGVIKPSLASRRTVFRHALAATLCTLALMATPAGPGIFRYLAFHADIFALHPVDEFRPLAWHSDAPLVIFAVALALILGLAAALRVRPHARDSMPVLGLALLAARHVRFGADFALLAAILVAPIVAALGTRWSTRLAPMHNAHLVRATGALLALLAFVPRLADIERHGRFLDIDLYRADLPLAALDFVDQHGLRERMYNDFETGGFLIWQGYPRHRVFVDPRLPAYPSDFHHLLGRSEISRAEWTQAMDRLGVTSALLDYAGVNRRVAWWDPGDWALVFRAHDTRVFVRRLPRLRDVIARYEIPASFTFTVEEGSAIIPLDTPPAGSPVPPCEWQIRLGDLYFDLDPLDLRVTNAYRAALTGPPGCLAPEHEAAACAWLGSVDRAAGRNEQALSLLDRSLAIAPEDTAVLSNRALALEALDRPREAAETWSRIAALAGDSPSGRIARNRARTLTRD